MTADPVRLEALFAGALAKASLEERTAYCDEVCAGNTELRQRLEALLKAHDEAGSFLQIPVARAGITADFPANKGNDPNPPPLPTECPGTRIGPYKLLQQIGEGGMGSVWMAEQQQPVRRMVALKVIKPGMDSKQVIARFEAERQALALMDHPNIAKVFDGGTTESGRPYFVMELVKGKPIHCYCDEQRLTPRERLQLFLPVCQAVQHAHQKGIIHRDLKPSNVLVAPYDGRPVPKVIDFGVAKAIGQRLTERTLYTEFGSVIGTLEYMSPEQAELNNQDIDTRSDVYSLGVLLYELLTGTTPLDRRQLKQAALMELLRLVREEEPPKPSTRLKASQESLPSISAQRQTEPARLPKLVQGELDWIVMKALEKDRSRRYETADGLAQDIDRYLHDEPVEACAQSTGYRLRKAARKYKKSLSLAAVLGTLLAFGIVLSAWQAVRARRAEMEAMRALMEARAQRAAAAETHARQASTSPLQARRRLYVLAMNQAQAAWQQGDVRHMLKILRDQQPHDGEADLRNFEWHYLWRLAQQHTQNPAIKAGAVTVDMMWNKRFHGAVFRSLHARSGRCAGVSPIGGVTIWDGLTGQELVTLQSRTPGVTVPTFSADGKRLALGFADGRICLWDTKTGTQVQKLAGGPRKILALALSADGGRLAIICRKAAQRDSAAPKDQPHALDEIRQPVQATIRVWNTITGQAFITADSELEEASSLAFSPNGQRLVIGSNEGTILFWDLEGEGGVHRLATHPGYISRASEAAFSPDGKLVAAITGDNLVRVFDAGTYQTRFTLEGHRRMVQHIAFSPDSQRLASASADETIKLWDLGIGQEILSLPAPADSVESLGFTQDGRQLLALGKEGRLRIWDAHSRPLDVDSRNAEKQ